MQSRFFGPESQSGMRGSDPQAIIQAQQATLDTTAKLSNLAYNFAMELNKTWLEIWHKQLNQLTQLPQRLAECRSPQQIVTAHAEIIGQTTQDLKDGFDRLAEVGEEMARETARAMKDGEDAVRSSIEQQRKQQPQPDQRH